MLSTTYVHAVVYIENHTIQYARLTCAQKLTRWPC